MTKEEAIKDIRFKIAEAKVFGESYVGYIKVPVLEMAIKALEQPEQKNGKWYPIKTRPLNDEEIKFWAEQHGCECEEYGEGDDYMCDGYMCLPPLPREGERVLICDASGNIDFYTYHFASQFELGMYNETDEDRPVAWMPLPEPYEEAIAWTVLPDPKEEEK